jgi:endonuclease YncB( thermonuclease family)
MTHWLILSFCLLILHPAYALEPRPWETLRDCRLLKKEMFDGDSFHVRHHGKDLIFRLLYVDTPEKKELGLTSRTTEQAKYWKIYKKDLYTLAQEALLLTEKHLSTPFTIHTRWEDARGNSQQPRYYATVTTSENQDLATLLVAHGLARIHGRPVQAPDGRPGQEVVKELKKIEQEAQKQKKGAWSLPQRGTKKSFRTLPHPVTNGLA